MTRLRSRLEENLGWVVLLALVVGCLVVLRPFVSALLWAVVLSFASWPIYRRLLRWLGNQRTLAAALMTLGMVLILLLPFLIVGLSLADNVREITLDRRGAARAPQVADQDAGRWGQGGGLLAKPGR